jgi:undecaprenyl-diphosphatase
MKTEIFGLDLNLFHVINGWAGNWLIDRVVKCEESLDLLKGGALLALYWLFWFRRASDQDERKTRIVAVLAGALSGLVISRALAAALPFRVRPLYDPLIDIKPLSIPVYPNLEHWNSFPSDSATYFVALAVGVWFLWRALGAGLLLWAIGYVCIPRVILGLHYPSDVAVGALIGILTVALTQHAAIRNRIAAPALALERKRPDLFYPLMFLVSYELVVVFADIRVPFRAITPALHRLGFSLTSDGVFVLAVGISLLAAAACALAIWMSRGWTTRAPSNCRRLR